MPVQSAERPRPAPHQTLADFELRRGTAADFGSVIELSEAVYGIQRSEASIRWLYEDNPAGPCAFWLAAERSTNRIVALRPVFPWRIRVRNREVLVGQAGDAMTHPDYQGRGLFSALVRAAWTELVRQEVPFAFSFSNPGSLSVYRKIMIGRGERAGSHIVLNFRRLVYPLSLDAVRERFGGPAGLLRGLDVAYRAFQRHRWAMPSDCSTFAVERFDDEFDDLWRRTGGRYGILTVRDSRYLNWRFIDAPSGRYHAIGLRKNGTLAGYVVFENDEHRCGSIADVFGTPDDDVIHALLGASFDAMRTADCLKASLWAPVESEMFARVKKFGFIARDDTFPMAVHVFDDGADAAVALEAREWLAWFGDRDVEHLVAPASPLNR